MSNSRYIKHLYSRAGFGIRFTDLHEIKDWPIKRVVRKLFDDSVPPEPINIVTENLYLQNNPNQTNEERKMIGESRNKQEKDLNTAWLLQMEQTNGQLREKMTLFWHNHFSCIFANAFYEQELNNIERENALGNFKTLLMRVSQSPSMLQFLNNQQNKKGHPNENFARELMELFTLGRGNYTEQDIKESARSFTGWGWDGETGKYVFRANAHDEGIKTFMGKSGNLSGEDIIDTILAKKQTALFITTKLYHYLVNDTLNPVHINQLADIFYKSNYEIKPLLQSIFLSDWFYEDKNIGNLIKSPIELLVGINRQFYVNYENPVILIQFQRTLGQLLFHPPNVAGWPGGINWIDSSSLMYRMKIPSIILNAGVIDFTGKADPEQEAYLAAAHKQQLDIVNKVQATPDWDKFLNGIPSGTSKIEIAQFLLEPNLNKNLASDVNQLKDTKALIIELVSTPEYQLC